MVKVVVSPTSAVGEEGSTLPEQVALGQNRPNPFNAETRIEYTLPRPAQVSLDVYNLLGQRVARLVSARQQAGSYSVPWHADHVASGVYFYRLSVDDAVYTRSMMLIK